VVYVTEPQSRPRFRAKVVVVVHMKEILVPEVLRKSKKLYRTIGVQLEGIESMQPHTTTFPSDNSANKSIVKTLFPFQLKVDGVGSPVL